MGYEELREYVLKEGNIGLGRPLGLSLFFRKGMAGWLEACRKLTIPHDSHGTVEPEKSKATETVFLDLRDQVVNLLSTMILSTAG